MNAAGPAVAQSMLVYGIYALVLILFLAITGYYVVISNRRETAFAWSDFANMCGLLGESMLGGASSKKGPDRRRLALHSLGRGYSRQSRIVDLSLFYGENGDGLGGESINISPRDVEGQPTPAGALIAGGGAFNYSNIYGTDAPPALGDDASINNATAAALAEGNGESRGKVTFAGDESKADKVSGANPLRVNRRMGGFKKLNTIRGNANDADFCAFFSLQEDCEEGEEDDENPSKYDGIDIRAGEEVSRRWEPPAYMKSLPALPQRPQLFSATNQPSAPLLAIRRRPQPQAQVMIRVAKEEHEDSDSESISSDDFHDSHEHPTATAPSTANHQQSSHSSSIKSSLSSSISSQSK